MTIYKCDSCGAVTDNDIFPSNWTTLQVMGPQGTENIGVGAKARHLCDKHDVEKMLKSEK
jgi:hypothetical protein